GARDHGGRPDRGGTQGARVDADDDRGRRRGRAERGVRSAGAARVPRARDRSIRGEAEPARRRDRARPSVRDDRCADHEHAAERPRDARRHDRPRDDVRRRRPRDGDGRRASELGPRLGAVALVLALGSSVAWGCADFGGGSLARRLPVLPVTIVSQAAGFVLLLVAVVVRGRVDAGALALGLLGGVGGGVGLAAFYKALSLGTMSVVSPIAACSALVPFTVSLATGERPAHVAIVGAAAALGGAVLASVEERRSASPERAR